MGEAIIAKSREEAWFLVGTLAITLVNTDASAGGDIKIVNALSVASNSAVEILDQPMVVEDSDIIKATASGANALHVILSVLEIT